MRQFFNDILLKELNGRQMCGLFLFVLVFFGTGYFVGRWSFGNEIRTELRRGPIVVSTDKDGMMRFNHIPGPAHR